MLQGGVRETRNARNVTEEHVAAPVEQEIAAATQARHRERVERYHAIKRLLAAGAEVADVAGRLGVSRKTVYRYSTMEQPPEHKRPARSGRPHVLDPYESYLLDRWNQGCHSAQRLWREICRLGYAGSSTTVHRFFKRVRPHGPVRVTRQHVKQTHPPSVRHMALLFVRAPDQRSEEHNAFIDHLCLHDAACAALYPLVQAFRDLLAELRGDALDGWLRQAQTSGVSELQSFARGLQRDLAAVRAGLSLPWSNGQTEGQIHRLKLLKRQTYGRAGFALLRLRVLHAATADFVAP